MAAERAGTIVAAPGATAWSSARWLALLPLALGLAGLVAGWTGGAWDVAWHRLVGRDTFWSPPHIGIYTGTLLNGLAALVATATALAGRPTRSAEIRLGPLHVERGLALVGFGVLIVILSAPVDELWHRLFGRDVDIWSPPHLLAIAGAGVVYLGWITAIASDAFALPPFVRRALGTLALAGFCGGMVFATNFYYMFGWAREGFFYPVVVATLLPFALGLGTTLFGAWTATAVAATYTAFALLTFATLRGFGWPPPAFPPLFLVGALAIDRLRYRGGRLASPLMLGLAFATTFVLAEGVRLALFPPPIPSSRLLSSAPGGIAAFYYAQAVARSWASLWPVLALLVATPLAALTWTVGGAVAQRLVDPSR